MKQQFAVFENEAALCAAFIAQLPPHWVAYPETGGFDILLIRKDDGTQVGIEAKPTLNAKVISQVTEDYWDCCHSGPDFRAVLVPYGKCGSFRRVCGLLGITVIEMRDKKASYENWFTPNLPVIEGLYWGPHDDWHDWAPTKRIELPDYVPDVSAGQPCPVKLTGWKIRAIKLAVMLERNGTVSRRDFKYLNLSPSRWVGRGVGWLEPGQVRGEYIAGRHMPDFKTQHPTNYQQIADDYEAWKPKGRPRQFAKAGQEKELI